MEHDPSYYVRKPSGRARMQVCERAKQFAPFAALTGLGKALERTRAEWLKKIEPSAGEGSDLDHFSSGNR